MESNIGERILKVMKQYDFDILQRNGQRISCVASWSEPVPPTDCEVFVGKIPKNCFEDELLPVMQMAGPVYEMRLMMDFSGQNRGYGFVKYTNLEYTEKATLELNEYEIRPNQKLAVVKANNNCKLLLTGLPVNISISELKEELGRRTEGLISVQVCAGVYGGLSISLEYRDHLSAAVARKRLQPEYVRRWGRRVHVAWPQDLHQANMAGPDHPTLPAAHARRVTKSSAGSSDAATSASQYQRVSVPDLGQWPRCPPAVPLQDTHWQLGSLPAGWPSCGLQQPAQGVSAAAWAAYAAALTAYSLGCCEAVALPPCDGCGSRVRCLQAPVVPGDLPHYLTFNRAPGSAIHKHL